MQGYPMENFAMWTRSRFQTMPPIQNSSATGIAQRTIAGIVALVLVAAAPASASPLVKLYRVETTGGAIERQFFGRVVAKETVDISFQVGGQVVEFPVSEGSTIPAGDLLARLDLEPFELALAQAKAQQDQAQRTLDRMEQLQGNAVSQVTVDDARTQADLADISFRDAERSLELATLHAPFDALVSARMVANLTTIGAGTPLVRLHDMSELRIEIEVPEILFQRAGRDPSITLFAEFPASGERYPLEVREFNAETAQVGQTYQITLGMAPPEDIVVLPGASAKVLATLQLESPRIEIPASSLVLGSDGAAHVMVFEPAGAQEGTVKKVSVEVEPSENGAVLIKSGLSQDQEIVVSGSSRLEDGETVRRFAGFTE